MADKGKGKAKALPTHPKLQEPALTSSFKGSKDYPTGGEKSEEARSAPAQEPTGENVTIAGALKDAPPAPAREPEKTLGLPSNPTQQIGRLEGEAYHRTLSDSPDWKKHCPLTMQERMDTLKRKASNDLLMSGVQPLSDWVPLRLAQISDTQELIEMQMQTLQRADRDVFIDNESSSDVLKTLQKETMHLSKLSRELLTMDHTLMQDLNEAVGMRYELTQQAKQSAHEVQDIFIHQILNSTISASSSRVLLPGISRTQTHLTGAQIKDWKYLVNEHLGSDRRVPEIKQMRHMERPCWCHVLGQWLPAELTKIAHIVPKSLNDTALKALFGSEEIVRTSKRNGISLHASIEQAFDRAEITFEPCAPFKLNEPTQWKLVILKQSLQNCVALKSMEDKDVYWRELDLKQLSFHNDNRPARRFLYFHSVFARRVAKILEWENFDRNLPGQNIWSSPCAPSGYLRRSILIRMGVEVGDKVHGGLLFGDENATQAELGWAIQLLAEVNERAQVQGRTGSSAPKKRRTEVVADEQTQEFSGSNGDEAEEKVEIDGREQKSS